MPWQAKPGCAAHHVAALERLVNSYPSEWLLAPQTDEIFDNLEHCNRRLRAFALAEGFDIVRNGGGTGAAPAYRFLCYYHGTHTKNNRKLEARVEKDKEGKITSKRQRQATNVRQLDCPWSALCSYKSVGKRGSGDKAFVLTIQNSIHSCKLVEDPLSIFAAHRNATEEWQQAIQLARKHREQVLPFSDSRRLIDAEEFGLVLSSRAYYNTVRKEIPDKSKPHTIEALLLSLHDQSFIYHTRISIEEDGEGKIIGRKLIQLFFAHRQQLEAAKRFVSNWLVVIDGTFNTNKDRLPLLVVVGVLNSGKTFPVCFSYCPSESAESIGFVWDALKAECFLPGQCPPPRVVLGDWAAGLIKSVPIAFPEAQFQGCDWHAAQAMLKWYRHKDRDYTTEEIEGASNNNNKKKSNTQAPLSGVPDQSDSDNSGLYNLSWLYIKSMSEEALASNRQRLYQALRPHDRQYLQQWVQKERQFVWFYTKTYPNLGSTSSQRGESYHPVIREITNSQLSFEESGKRLSRKMLSVLKDLATDEDSSLRSYNRLAQLDFAAFKHLRIAITNYALAKIEGEWHSLKQALLADQDTDLGRCRCEILLRFGLPCKHHLLRAYNAGMPIPKSLIHPRWLLKGPVVHPLVWQPRYPNEEPVVYQQPAAQGEALGLEIEMLYAQLQPEERARYTRQIEAEQQKLVLAGKQHLQLQALPIGNPDPLPNQVWKKKKTHDRADARALTGAEINEREHAAREAELAGKVARKAAGATPPSTPPRAGESQYQTTIEIGAPLAIRPSPRAPRTHFTLFSREDSLEDDSLGEDSPEASPEANPEAAFVLPASTAPPRLEKPISQASQRSQGRGKRRKAKRTVWEAEL